MRTVNSTEANRVHYISLRELNSVTESGAWTFITYENHNDKTLAVYYTPSSSRGHFAYVDINGWKNTGYGEMTATTSFNDDGLEEDIESYYGNL